MLLHKTVKDLINETKGQLNFTDHHRFGRTRSCVRVYFRWPMDNEVE